MDNKEKKLTDKQERFCEEYLVDLDKKKAAIRAGFSSRTASQTASRLLNDDKIQEKIAVLKAKRSERLNFDQDKIVKKLEKIADFDIRKLYRDNGRHITPAQLDEETAKIVKVTPTGKIIPEDRMQAIDMLCKHFGMFKEQKEHSGEIIVYNIDKPNKPKGTGQ